MAVNKVVYNAQILIDLTSDTVSADTLLKGYTAHDKSGNLITGTYEGGSGSATNGYIILNNENELPNSTNGTLALIGSENNYSKLYMRVNDTWLLIMSKYDEPVQEGDTLTIKQVYNVVQEGDTLEIDNPTLTMQTAYSVKQDNDVLEVE